MAVSKTTVRGPDNFATGMKIAVYNILWDSAYATGGEPVDVSTDFDHIFACIPGGNDTAADNGYLCQAVCPAYGTAVGASSLKLTLWKQSATSGALVQFTGSASAIGATSITVIGD